MKKIKNLSDEIFRTLKDMESSEKILDKICSDIFECFKRS